MVFYNLRVGTFNLKYMPFKENEKDYERCDKDGNILSYVSGTRTNGYYINPKTNERHDKAFYLINGKAQDKLSRTKETDKYREVELKEIENLINPKMYYVKCDNLLNNLSDSEKALKFGLSFGGTKVYYAYIFVNKLLNCLEMWISTTPNKIEQLKEIAESEKDKKKLKEISITIDGIDKAKIEELIAI